MNKDQKHKKPNFPNKEVYKDIVEPKQLSPLEQANKHEADKLKG